jgi:nitroreductase
MNKSIFTLLLAAMAFSATAQDIQLPEPQKTGGMPLMEALSLRQTTREFSPQELDMQTLSDLLWAAYGFNRPGKRVVPSANNKQEIDLYVCLKSGIYFYDAKANVLIQKVEGDHRKSMGKQEFVWDAPLNLIFVGNSDISGSYQIDSGFIVQNVYLFCASEDLATVVRGFFDAKEVHQLMNLTDKQVVVITQTVGHKK